MVISMIFKTFLNTLYYAIGFLESPKFPITCTILTVCLFHGTAVRKACGAFLVACRSRFDGRHLPMAALGRGRGCGWGGQRGQGPGAASRPTLCFLTFRCNKQESSIFFKLSYYLQLISQYVSGA